MWYSYDSSSVPSSSLCLTLRGFSFFCAFPFGLLQQTTFKCPFLLHLWHTESLNWHLVAIMASQAFTGVCNFVNLWLFRSNLVVIPGLGPLQRLDILCSTFVGYFCFKLGWNDWLTSLWGPWMICRRASRVLPNSSLICTLSVQWLRRTQTASDH